MNNTDSIVASRSAPCCPPHALQACYRRYGSGQTSSPGDAAAHPRGQHLGDLCLADKNLRDGIRQVVPEERIQPGDVTAGDALDLARAPAPKLPAPPPGTRIPQQVRYDWRVLAPRIPGKATELRRRIEREETGKDGKPRKVVDEQST